MSKKILAFGASNSKNSINRKLAAYTAQQIQGAEVQLLDLNDFEMPIYSVDREAEDGIHQLAKDFKQHIREADGIIISFAEYNGSYTSAYKNIYDWVSRIEMNVWENKPMLLLASSPGRRGAISVLKQASASYRFSNQNTIAEFSLPSFHQNFSEEKGITNADLEESYRVQMELFSKAL